MKIGSLFDGSGGFPLAAKLCGMEPIWASEIEPYPIAVTRSRFPNMKHLGSVTDINGAEIEPVDIITFGSPCQGLSAAGKGLGLSDPRSGLLLHAVRIIKEMRGATNGIYPRFAIWENVPGAFSSNKGEDFRVVLEEFIKIVEPTAPALPTPDKGKWPYSGCYMGEGWSLAWRVLDAQYWGVPQRRRRIFLVLDLRGERAGEILFKREGLRRHFAESGTPWKAVTADAERSIGAADCEGAIGIDVYNQSLTGDKSKTLNSAATDADYVPCVAYTMQDREGKPGGGKGFLLQKDVSTSLRTSNYQYPFQPVVTQQVYDARGNGDGEVVPTLTGDHENRVTDYTAVVCIEGNGTRESHQGNGYSESDKMYTLNTIERHAVAYGVGNRKVDQTKLRVVVYDGSNITSPVNAANPQPGDPCHTLSTDSRNLMVMEAICIENNADAPHQQDLLQTSDDVARTIACGTHASGSHLTKTVINTGTRYIVRRLTPTECARLQGFPDKWGHPDVKDELTDEEYSFWLEVRNTHAAINGKAVKEYTKQQMLTWYNKLHTDSSEYKMWGNGIALPCALYVMQGIEDTLKEKHE